MFKLVVIFLTFLSGWASAAEMSVPKSFVNGEVANAEDFNSNNNYLIEKIIEEKAKVEDLLEKARWKNADVNGAVSKTIDCTMKRC